MGDAPDPASEWLPPDRRCRPSRGCAVTSDARTDEFTALGRRNLEVIGLVTRHCRHARVELSPLMGHGMLEAVTGLPINGREVRCPHAANGSMAGMQMESIAIDFYRRNCVGCEHRDTAGVPNLKGLVDEIDEQQRRAGELAARHEDELTRARRERAGSRTSRAAGEPEPTRRLVALLNGIDAAEPDDSGERLLDLARAAPEICTPLAAELIVDAAQAAPAPRLIEAVGHLCHHGRITQEAALGTSLNALANGNALREAAELMVELRTRVTATSIRPAIPALIALAGPLEWLGPRPKPYADGLAVAVAVDLPAVLDELLPLIASEHKHIRASAARAAGTLLSIEPAAASVLVGPLLQALTLPGSQDPYAGSPRGPLLDALRQAMAGDPQGTTATLLDAGATLAEEERDALVGVFAGVGRARPTAPVDPATLERAVHACVLLADGRWGERAALAAAEALDWFARDEPEATLPYADALFGTLIGAVAQPLDVEATPGLEDLARASAQALRRGRLSRLTDALGELVKANPDVLRDNVLTVLDADDPPGEAATKLRRELVELLAPLGGRPDGLVLALPRLYSALLHGDAGVRASGIRAWSELSRTSGFTAPAELEDLIPALIADPYVAVHHAMVSALLFAVDVPERHLRSVLLTVLRIADIYASEDGYFLDDVINLAWQLSLEFDEPIRVPVQVRLLQHAQHLAATSDLRRLLTGPARELHGAEMVARLLEAIRGDAANPDDHGVEDILRLLREQPADILVQHADAISDAARSYLPTWTTRALELVEPLQVCGRHDLAVQLAEQVVAAIPDTAEQTMACLGAATVLDAARVEFAVATGDDPQTRAALEDWRNHEEQLDRWRRDRVAPWAAES
jgi:hypothetical protein